MSIERVKSYLSQWGKDKDVLEFAVSSATVELAAQAAGVEPARIAKTLSFTGPGGSQGECILVVTAGDSKVNGSKFKAQFGVKSKMLSPEDALAWTGYAVGGVCPFAIDAPQVRIWLDVSLQRFASVFPACGSSNSSIELRCDELFLLSNAAGWVDVCTGWE